MSKFLNLLKGDQHPVEPEAEPQPFAERYENDMYETYCRQGKSPRMARAMARDAAGKNDLGMSEDEYCGDFDE